MDDPLDESWDWTAVLHLAPAALAELERERLPVWRQWHEQALSALAARLRTGDVSAEPNFLMVLERLGNRLLLDDPEGFAAFIDSIADLPLTTPDGQQLLRYFQGVSLARRDQYEAALALFDELLALPNLTEYIRGRTLNSRALYCRVIGRLQEAVTGYQASLALWQQQGNRLRAGLAWLNLGNIAHQLQEYDESESCLQQAAACFQEVNSPQWLAAAQSGLGLVYRDRGEWETAVALFETVIARRRADGAQDALGRVLTNLSETYLMQERLAEAVQAATAALAALGTKVYAVDAYVALGLSQQAGGELGAAKETFTTALELALAIGRKDILAEVHYRLGDVWRRLGDDAAALAQWEAGVAVIESTRQPLRDEGVKISLLGRWQQLYEVLVLHYLALGQTAAAFAWAERARARAFLEAVGEPLAESPTFSQMPVLPPRQMLLSYFTTGVRDREVPWLRQLPATSRLRQHILPPAHTLCFCLTADGLTAYDCGLDPNALIWDLPRGDDRHRFLDKTVQRPLYDLLIPDRTVNEADHLFVAPHGPLHEVPFAALLAADERPLLHKDGPQLTIIPSATFWQQHRARQPGQVANNCLAVGYDGVVGGQQLRHTEAEAQFIAKLTGGEAWTGAQPKAAALRERVRVYRWLHVACHGRFRPDAPLDSFLETGLDEKLTAREVAHHWPLAAELVTLSACQTGVSRFLRGDEPLGLVRAFLAAGARQVLVTQWAVADLPTYLLMQQFYRQLMNGAEAAAALQAAQVWLQSATLAEVRAQLLGLPQGEAEVLVGERPFAHPRYWAAFMLVGV
ncbi:MAG: CHAT domain-containing protein [Ardenticatenaceae bacterium]|nr:CHAT domain-containing protein [Ardenticatenaceae bacterium]